MPFRGIILSTIISIPIWLVIILLVQMKMIIVGFIVFTCLAILGRSIILSLGFRSNGTVIFPTYEVRHAGEHEWHKISEREVMEKLVESFDPVSPILYRIIRGEEIIISQEIYRKFQMRNIKLGLT
jgi:hypothetical protein